MWVIIGQFASSLFCFFSKVLEKPVAMQLMNHLDINNYLHALKFGFRPNFSAESANCYILETKM